MDRTFRAGLLFHPLSALRAAWAGHHQRRLARRDLNILLSLDDALLEDIGLSRGDLADAAALPPDADPTQELARRSWARRTAAHRAGRGRQGA